jgi:hypothetical protein
VIRDLLLPVMFRYLITARSLARMYDHRVAPDRPAADDAIQASWRIS